MGDEAGPIPEGLAALVWPNAVTTATPSSLPSAAAARLGLHTIGGKGRER